ncbi:thioredoxin domain-containing protein, partial [Escherichia coli]|nr:thioredoxin domain-containing protein [Escherichia coli]
GAPKFPHCPELELLLDLSATSLFLLRQGEGKNNVELTLTRMAKGGIHDQIGGGFCRYSVDERWEIPHFEKMLYDNAQLLPLYAEAARSNATDQHKPAAAVVGKLVDWLTREMTAPHGGFYAALDADSEGEEGKFYVWQRDEVHAALSEEEFKVVEPYYGFNRPPNFEHAAWNPIVAQPLDAIAQTIGVSQPHAE